MTEASEHATIYELSHVGLDRDGKTLLEDFSLEIADRAVTVVLGPAGTGKSTLLQTLAGKPVPDGVVRHGTWTLRGQALTNATQAPQDLAFCAQRKGRVTVSEPVQAWRETLAVGARIVLLDEPTRGCSDTDVDDLVSALRTHATRGAAVVVTHDVAFAKRVADEVCFFVAGKLNVHGSARAVFDQPPTRVFERFLAQGNCWPSVPPPALPSHFRWLLPRRLAGMAYPGLLDDLEADLTAVAFAGIQVVVNLTEEPFPQDKLRAFGLQGRHLAVRDMDVPAVGPAARMCRDIERCLNEGRPVAVHCRAGVGRTGTMLAAYLVWMGLDPDAAIAQVRAVSAGYIQTRQQEQFIHRFKENV